MLGQGSVGVAVGILIDLADTPILIRRASIVHPDLRRLRPGFGSSNDSRDDLPKRSPHPCSCFLLRGKLYGAEEVVDVPASQSSAQLLGLRQEATGVPSVRHAPPTSITRPAGRC